MSALKKESLIQPDFPMIESLDAISSADIAKIPATIDCIFFGAGEPHQILEHAIKTGKKHFISIDSILIEEQKQLALIPKNDLGKIFNNPGALFSGDLKKSREHLTLSQRICNRGDKSRVLGRTRAKLEKINASETLISEVLLVAEELVSNAIFNAPFVPLDNLRSGIDRRGVALKNNITELASFELHISNSAIMVSCVDRFGRLNTDAFIKRIRDCYDKGLAQMMNMGPGGAKIGSYLIFHYSMGLYLFVEKEKATCVASTFPRNMSSKKRESLAKSLHIIEIIEEEK